MAWYSVDREGLALNIRGASEQATQKTAKKATKKAVWLLHGYGADEQDLAGVAEYMDPASDYTWILPRGPKEVGFGQYVVGRSWFDLDVPGIQASISRGDAQFLEAEISPALAAASAELIPVIEKISVEYDEVVFAGFSQGSFVAFDLFLSLWGSQSFSVPSCLLFSSAMARPVAWSEKINHLEGQNIFQSHGLQDTTLPLIGADMLKIALETSKASYQFIGFEGGHEIPAQVLNSAKKVLSV